MLMKLTEGRAYRERDGIGALLSCGNDIALLMAHCPRACQPSPKKLPMSLADWPLKGSRSKLQGRVQKEWHPCEKHCRMAQVSNEAWAAIGVPPRCLLAIAVSTCQSGKIKTSSVINPTTRNVSVLGTRMRR